MSRANPRVRQQRESSAGCSRARFGTEVGECRSGGARWSERSGAGACRVASRLPPSRRACSLKARRASTTDVSERHPTSDRVPHWAEPWRVGWREPWRVPASPLRWIRFKARLWRHGYLSPNFRRSEATSGPDTCRCPAAEVPRSLMRNAQRHAFTLERVRHAIGDRPMVPLSWYRSQCHNRCVGGATGSRHLVADATDWSDAEAERLGGDRFHRAMRDTFGDGGIGFISDTSRVRHVDNGPRRTWTY